MFTDIATKKQGNGQDSWIIKVWSGTKKGDGDLLSTNIVYEDPAIEKLVDISKVDISTLRPQQIADLKTLLGI